MILAASLAMWSAAAADRRQLERIDHFVFVVPGDRSFNSYFGAYPLMEGGEPSLDHHDIPNYWTWARQYVLHDQFYNDGDPFRPRVDGLAARLRQAGVSSRVYREVDQFEADAATGALPAVSWVAGVQSSHRDEMRWVTRVMNAFARSRHWWRGALFVAWDTPGNFPDHLPGRVPALSMGAFMRGGYEDHSVRSHDSWLRTLEARFGLRGLVQAPGRDMFDPFDFTQEAREPFQLDVEGRTPLPTDRPVHKFGAGWLTNVHVAHGVYEVAPDSMVLGYLEGLREGFVAATPPFREELDGIRVSVQDEAGARRGARVVWANEETVCYVMPAETAPGLAQVIVSGPRGTHRGPALVTPLAPGILTASAKGQGPAGSIVTVRRAGSTENIYPYRCNRGVCTNVAVNLLTVDEAVLILFGSGLRTGRDVEVRIGGTALPARYTGADPDIPGLDRIEIVLSRSLAGRGQMLVQVTVDGMALNPVQVAFE